MARERKMVAGKLFLWELDEAVHAYLAHQENGDSTDAILDLVLGSSKTFEKKFWAKIDRIRKEQNR